MELLLLNRPLVAKQALDWGLVNEIADDAELLDRALEVAAQLANGATGAFGLSKRLVAHALGALESHMTLESETIASQAASVDGVEGIRAFLEKRKPDFSGNGTR
jgi:2-(1,2-epoxy-1,2-dihydrophenyl)acetyl-CoA isomerase